MSDPAIALAPLWSLCLASGPTLSPDRAWSAWRLAPVVVMPLIAFGVIYAAGKLRQVAESARSRMLRLEATAAASAVTLLTVALVSPLCRLSATLAWAHMVQHLILVALAPPLIVLAAPVRTIEAGLRAYVACASRKRIEWNRPLIATGLYGFLIWFWHVPAMYELGLISASWHVLYIGSLIAVSLWFWSCVVHATSPGLVAVTLLVTMVHTGLLGALLTFAPSPLYPLMATGAMRFGLLPIEDQQLAGLIMWVPMGMIYLVSALLVINRRLFASTIASAGARGTD
ncbi:cytochrome c oxidase assembly protein [Bradyrhizobium sp. LHD-71]|uniref:cytochrome c oxidase assembly protein n=1 Tax=Bradyrhizobium sp. LHD-71 TaxID=3072141 RepID=UPI00280F4C79|nr:cytochrome c oxidase assembly protein [Bradyrhizobium sp. LHD-71]MDQ8732163.1 cytochrome c oxidase assembly protein [Bradyrhizobium sp. LHD-71]